MKIEYGEIIPGVCLGEFTIGMKKEDIIKMVGYDFKEKVQWDGYGRIYLENAIIWFDNNGIVEQIGVTKGFKECYKNVIKIGATLGEIRKNIGEYMEIDSLSVTYGIIGMEGISFELEDVKEYDDEWDEKTAPIEWIYIYRISKTDKMISKFITNLLIGFENKAFCFETVYAINSKEYIKFALTFEVYENVPVLIEYDSRKGVGYCIGHNQSTVDIENSRPYLPENDFGLFVKELKQEIAMKIADRY